MRIAFISCVKTKKNGTHRADELYISTYFKYSLRYAEKHFDKVYILSAKYGLLERSDFITKYEVTLKNKSVKEKKIWSILVYRDIVKKIHCKNLTFIAGKDYSEYLIILLKKAGYNVDIFLPHLMFGQKLQYFKNHI